MIDASEFAGTAAFLSATTAHIRTLRAEQRHDGAARSAVALARLLRTIRAAQTDHGFNAFLLLGAEMAEAERVCAEFAA